MLENALLTIQNKKIKKGNAFEGKPIIKYAMAVPGMKEINNIIVAESSANQ